MVYFFPTNIHFTRVSQVLPHVYLVIRCDEAAPSAAAVDLQAPDAAEDAGVARGLQPGLGRGHEGADEVCAVEAGGEDGEVDEFALLALEQLGDAGAEVVVLLLLDGNEFVVSGMGDLLEETFLIHHFWGIFSIVI